MVTRRWALWLVLFLPILFISILARFISPFACFFVVRAPYTTTVKRLGRSEVTLNRDRLVWWLSWFDTFDNATDEYWYGMYGPTANMLQVDYDQHSELRWWYRVLWLQRNSSYGFNYSVLSLDKDSPYAFQIKKQLRLPFGYYNDVNIGWKAHKNFDRLMYAGRLLGIRKTQ